MQIWRRGKNISRSDFGLWKQSLETSCCYYWDSVDQSDFNRHVGMLACWRVGMLACWHVRKVKVSLLDLYTPYLLTCITCRCWIEYDSVSVYCSLVYFILTYKHYLEFNKHYLDFKKHYLEFNKHYLDFKKHYLDFKKHYLDFKKHYLDFKKHYLDFKKTLFGLQKNCLRDTMERTNCKRVYSCIVAQVTFVLLGVLIQNNSICNKILFCICVIILSNRNI